MSIFLTINTRPSMKIGVVVASILFLLYAILTPQKYGFYILLRVFIFAGMLYLAKVSHEENREFFLYRFLIIAFIYNPIIKLPLGKDWWIIINLFTIAFLSYALLKYIIDQNKEASLKNKNNKNMKSNEAHTLVPSTDNEKIINRSCNDIDLVENYSVFDTSLNKLNKKIAKKNITSWPFKGGLAPIEKDEFYGYLNKNGEIVIDFIYEEVGPFFEGLARVMIDDKYGFINTRGEIVIEPIYENVHSFNEGLAPVMINDKYGYINKNNELVVEPIFYNADCFNEGRALVSNIDPILSKLSGDVVEKWSYIDKKGRYKIKQKLFQEFNIEESLINGFSEGLAIFRKHIRGITSKKYGYIDKNGKVAIKAIFDYAGKFSEGLAYVEYGKHQGYINREGKFLISNIINTQNNLDPTIQIDRDCNIYRIEKSYTQYYDFIEEYDEEDNDDKDIITDLNIASCLEEEFDSDYYYPERPKRNYQIYDFSEGLAVAAIWQEDEDFENTLQYGYINKKGCFVIAPIFDDARSFCDGVALVKFNDRYLYIRNPLKKYNKIFQDGLD